MKKKEKLRANETMPHHTGYDGLTSSEQNVRVISLNLFQWPWLICICIESHLKSVLEVDYYIYEKNKM